jgi:hypothetical protein
MGTQCAARYSGRTIHLSIGSPSPLTSFASNYATGLEYPYIMALLRDQTIQVHNIESQEIAQEVLAPPLPSPNETSRLFSVQSGGHWQ